jgi:hypothetical protein
MAKQKRKKSDAYAGRRRRLNKALGLTPDGKHVRATMSNSGLRHVTDLRPLDHGLSLVNGRLTHTRPATYKSVDIRVRK